MVLNKQCLTILAAFLCLSVFAVTADAGTIVHHGSVFEFGGPDDLLLNPSSAVIAVNVNGDQDRMVNGVLFQTDGQGGTSGTATSGGVSVTTSAANQINGWAAAPAFTGADPTSAANMSLVMQDIRWAAAPDPLTVEIDGLVPGGLYNLQLLTNEGADRNRNWDLGVGNDIADALNNMVVDNIGSEGDNSIGVWTPGNSFGYEGDFTASPDGTLAAVMQQQIGGADPDPTDNNPILQAIIVHSVPEPSTFALAALGLLTVVGFSLRRHRQSH